MADVSKDPSQPCKNSPFPRKSFSLTCYRRSEAPNPKKEIAVGPQSIVDRNGGRRDRIGRAINALLGRCQLDRTSKAPRSQTGRAYPAWRRYHFCRKTTG